ncbi:MAG: T9SS type A sorting domain-containing protein [Bacteroidetes bacterium]|nr:T9SS type A sorting domain-containing protein [Bacteroidota bacterium]
MSDDFAVNGERDYTTFNGTGNIRNGRFVKFDHFLPALKGTAGFDAFGFPFQTQQDSLANLKNYFKFSRPEDVETNPNDPTQVIFASTGLSSIFNGVDSWGTTYLIDFNDSSLMAKLNMPLSQIDNIEASLKVVYDGNDAGGGLFSGPDFGLRSPDNLTWASNGMVYLQEDKSVTGFGLTSGMEASVFELDPMSGAMARILEMDRNAVPFMQSDVAITDLGNWESSGILDVTNLFETKPGEVVLLFDVQAHSAANGLINGSANLVQGGQLCLATKIFPMVQSSNKSIATSNVTESESKEDLVFPNPAVDKLNFIERNTGTVKNAEGKEVLKFTATNNIDIQTLPVGVYTVIFANGSESKFVKK